MNIQSQATASKTPGYYANLKQELSAQADTLNETLVDGAVGSDDVFVSSQIWNREKDLLNSTQETRELTRSEGQLSYHVTTRDLAGKTVAERNISYTRQADGSFKGFDFDGNSIVNFSL